MVAQASLSVPGTDYIVALATKLNSVEIRDDTRGGLSALLPRLAPEQGKELVARNYNFNSFGTAVLFGSMGSDFSNWLFNSTIPCSHVIVVSFAPCLAGWFGALGEEILRYMMRIRQVGLHRDRGA